MLLVIGSCVHCAVFRGGARPWFVSVCVCFCFCFCFSGGLLCHVLGVCRCSWLLVSICVAVRVSWLDSVLAFSSGPNSPRRDDSAICQITFLLASVPRPTGQRTPSHSHTLTAGMLTFVAVTLFSALGCVRRFFYEEVAEMSREGGLKTEPLLSMAAQAPRHLVAMTLVLIWTTR